MPKRSSKKKRQDINELAASIVDEATSDQPIQTATLPGPDPNKNPAAVALGRLGGLKGGKARAKNMTKKERSEAARRAANKRWGKNKRKKKK
jgi:hypothetical protein